MTLVPLDAETLPATKAMQEVAVSTYLEHAKTWLASAVEATGPEQIAQAKAEIATAAEATKQLNLSKEIQFDAQEMVRRAEFALGKAIRKGQAEGTVIIKADGAAIRDGTLSSGVDKVSPRSFYGPTRSEGSKAYQDGNTFAATNESTFNEALSEAKSEGNLSRANVVRKIKQQATPTTRDARADLIGKLADEGYSIRQMPGKVGIGEEAIRLIVRDYRIEVPAERSIARTKRHDSTRIVAQTVTALEGLVMGVELIDYDDLDESQASQWVDSLNHSMTALKRFHQQIRKATQ